MSPVFGFFDFDVKKAETGIIYIDEVDKIARKADNPSIARDVRRPRQLQAQQGHGRAVREGAARGPRTGLIPEFIGRLPVISVIHQLSREDLVTILTEPRKALVKQFQRFFEFGGSTSCSRRSRFPRSPTGRSSARRARAASLDPRGDAARRPVRVALPPRREEVRGDQGDDREGTSPHARDRGRQGRAGGRRGRVGVGGQPGPKPFARAWLVRDGDGRATSQGLVAFGSTRRLRSSDTPPEVSRPHRPRVGGSGGRPPYAVGRPSCRGPERV